jgi:hypothetical protein
MYFAPSGLLYAVFERAAKVPGNTCGNEPRAAEVPSFALSDATAFDAGRDFRADNA